MSSAHTDITSQAPRTKTRMISHRHQCQPALTAGLLELQRIEAGRRKIVRISAEALLDFSRETSDLRVVEATLGVIKRVDKVVQAAALSTRI